MNVSLSSTSISRQFVDGLGRNLMTKTEAEPAPGGTTSRAVISQAVQFNAREKPSRMLNPCFSLQGGTTLDELLAFENIEDPGWQGQVEQDGTLCSLLLAAMPFRDSHRYPRMYKSVSSVLSVLYTCNFLCSTPLSWGCETILSFRWLPSGLCSPS